MPSLLSIPEELLDKIIEIVILTERPPPADVATADQDRTKHSSLSCRSWGYGPNHVRFEKSETSTNSTTLLLTNRQLHQQTSSALRRLYPNGLTYKLDCIFLNEAEILPTWTHIPAVSKRISCVDVTFRIFETNTGKGCSAFCGGDGGPPEIVWTFFYLLEHFLEFGTASSSSLIKEGSKQIRGCVVAVDSISLDFTSGEPNKPVMDDTPEGKRAWQSRIRRDRWSDSEDDEVSRLPMHPRWLADYVSSNLRPIVNTSYHTASFATIIFERVGSFTVSSEGQNILQFDVGQKLAKADHRPDRGHDNYTTSTFGNLPGDCRIPTFWNWKHQAVQLRKERNLSLEEADVVWPTLEDMKRWRGGAEKERKKDKEKGYSLICDGRRCMCKYRGLEDMLEIS